MAVYSADGTKLGKVTECQPDSFFIEKGFFFPKEYIARYDDIADIRGDDLHLRLTDEMLKTGDERAATSSELRGEGLESRTDLGSEAALTGTTKSVDVPVVEEELIAEKRVREAGEVRVHKDVTTEHRQITVPVTKEEVRVERVPADASAKVGEGAFEEGTMSIPVREEEVEIRKRPVVREQVRVSRTARQEERRADADVRRENVRIEGEGEEVRREDLERSTRTPGIRDPDEP
ncbi:MAG TPA: YsnF/AvaK domain-containing protein [Anaeromyxobacteraceae bacterium]|nr:YsnF/AvaK domain-containing protein [Anaeromyxobacteraceae bacterium]